MNPESASEFIRKPLDVKFESIVDLTIHDAHLATAGLLQCDPTAKVELVTIRRWMGDPAGPSYSIQANLLGQTSKKIFTSTPKFDETLHFTVSDTSVVTTTGVIPSSTPSTLMDSSATSSSSSNANDEVENRICITFEDSTSKAFLGLASCPFSPFSPSMSPPASPVRVMLQPRNIGMNAADPLFLEDTATLRAQGIDDFGYVNLSWKVSLIPLGGALDVVLDPAVAMMMSAAPAQGGSSGADPLSLGGPVALPIGVTIKAAWLIAQEGDTEVGKERGSMSEAVHYSVSVSFGDAKRFPFPEGGKPLFLTLHTAPHLQALIFTCSSHNMYRPDLSRDIAVVVPLPPLTTGTSVDRDIHWVAPVRSVWGEDLGILTTTVRLSRRPLEGNMPACPSNATCLQINDPKHQEEFSHVAVDFGRPPPDTPSGAYQMLFWESEEHIRYAMERQRQRGVVLAAKPTEEHVRHIFDVLMGRSILDESVAKVACNVFQCPTSSDLVALQLKKLMVAFAFHCRTLSILEAARFLFLAFRSDVEDAIAVEEFHFMLQNSLLQKTVDMPEGEMRRWVTDLVGSSLKVLHYKDFITYILRNFGFWYWLGVGLKMDRSSSSVPLSHLAHQEYQRRRCPSATSVALTPVPFHYTSPTCPTSFSCGGATRRSSRTSGSPPSQSFVDTAASRQSAASLSSSTSAGGGRCRRSSTSEGKNVQFKEKQNEIVSSSSSTGGGGGGNAGMANLLSSWRTFVVRVGGSATPKAFSVTAHTEDKIKDVMKMIEESAGIKAECQQWKLNNEVVLAPMWTIGSTTLGIEPSIRVDRDGGGGGAAPPAPEVFVYEMEENVVIRFVFKEKNKHWQQRFPVKEKVLHVRASVQRQTLLPLSRCMLRLVRNRKALILQDRHTLSHYSPQSNEVVEVTEESH